jgi:hypothetical protein
VASARTTISRTSSTPMNDMDIRKENLFSI